MVESESLNLPSMNFQLPYSIILTGASNDELAELQSSLAELKLPCNAQVSANRATTEHGSLASVEVDLINLIAAFPQHVTVDIAAFLAISRVVLKAISIWAASKAKKQVKIRSGDEEIVLTAFSESEIKKVLTTIFDKMRK